MRVNLYVTVWINQRQLRCVNWPALIDTVNRLRQSTTIACMSSYIESIFGWSYRYKVLQCHRFDTGSSFYKHFGTSSFKKKTKRKYLGVMSMQSTGLLVIFLSLLIKWYSFHNYVEVVTATFVCCKVYHVGTKKLNNKNIQMWRALL